MITEQDIIDQNHPFYVDGNVKYPCPIVITDSNTSNNHINTIKTYQQKINMEYSNCIERINKLQQEGLQKLNNNMKEKEVYYWSKGNTKYTKTNIKELKFYKGSDLNQIFYLPVYTNYQQHKLILSVVSKNPDPKQQGKINNIEFTNSNITDNCNLFNNRMIKNINQEYSNQRTQWQRSHIS